MKKVLMVTVLAILLSTTNLFADCPPECTTCVSGTVVNETWTEAGSPYCVEGDILVAGLTIEPGVSVEILGDYVFEVAGILTVAGTKTEPVVFTRFDTNEEGWQGIFFNYSSPGSELEYCVIEGSINSGVRILNSLPVFDNCTISNNEAYMGGGLNIDLTGLLVGDELTLKDCIVMENSSSSNGGGIKAGIEDASLILQGCRIIGNIANPLHSNGKYGGGGIHSQTGDGKLVLSNCAIEENTCYSRCTSICCSVSNYGGGIYNAGNLTLQQCMIRKNRSWAIDGASGGCEHNYSYGGGIFHTVGALTTTNCIISHNFGNPSGTNPTRRGCGIYVDSGTADILNCTIAYNENEGLRNGAGTVTALNSIFYFNTVTQIAGTATVTYSDVQDGYTGEGNISYNPIFGSCGPSRIVLGSMCIDAGNPDSQYNDVCFPPSLGTERNDMGAHGGPWACGWPDDCPCDLNYDGKCDMQDWLLFGEDWGRTDCNELGVDCECDLNVDGKCDMQDWLCFGEDWGRTDCP